MIFFVTGAKGFLGRHLSKRLGYSSSVKVIGIGHGKWLREDFEAWGVTDWLEGEINHSNLSLLAETHGTPDGVFHLAGGSSVGPSLQSPYNDFEKSVISTSNVCEWIRTFSPKSRAVLASSAAVYGGGHPGLISEKNNLNPYSPYGFNKRMCELSFESYSRNFNINTSAIRFFSIYGPELRKQLLWDICSRLAKSEKSLQLGGSGNELRDWLHVDDACRLMEIALKHSAPSCPIINGGTGISTSVRSIADAVLACWGTNSKLTFSSVSRPGDPESLIADISLAQSVGFNGYKDINQGIHEYVSWFKREINQK